MKVSFRDRLLAYLIDVLIMLLFSVGISYLLNINISYISSEFDVIKDSYFSGDIGFREYLYRYSLISYAIDRKQLLLYVINLVYVFTYYVLVPFFNAGKTFGKSFIKIRVIGTNGNYLSLFSLILRAFITVGLFSQLLSILLLNLNDGLLYFIIVSIVNFIQFLLVIISAFMIIYRRDKCGLEDIISHSKVVKE